MKTSTNPTIEGFQFATGDVNYLDYGATWVKQTGAREYHFIQLINWEDAVGKDAREIGKTYNLELSVVNLAEVPDNIQLEALHSCGSNDADLDDKWRALACMEYGTKALIRSIDTSNFRTTFRELARLSRTMTKDTAVHNQEMSRPANRLGSTASEMMRGDLTSALVRGVIEEKPEALLMAKIYAACAPKERQVYEVIVGNIGTVYSGNDEHQARTDFDAYKELASHDMGRAAGESVTLMCAGEILDEYNPQ